VSWLLLIGGNSEIGFATAKIFASNGYNIHLASRNMEQLNLKKETIKKSFNVECEVSNLDLFNLDSIKNFVNQNQINPKVIMIAAGFLENPEKSYEKIIKINYLNLIEIIENLILKNLDKNILSSIIGISSIAGEKGKKKNNIYSSSKAGFSNYLDGLRQRLYKENINVITIKPGYVRTKMIKSLNLPKALVSTPEKVGKIIFKSYKKKKAVVYAPYYWKLVMFIYKLVPELIFKYIEKKNF
jgi:decaprenylphospho-beta-D-erythro-pentofuranosid-2-ulose 2-reductase